MELSAPVEEMIVMDRCKLKAIQDENKELKERINEAEDGRFMVKMIAVDLSYYDYDYGWKSYMDNKTFGYACNKRFIDTTSAMAMEIEALQEKVRYAGVGINVTDSDGRHSTAGILILIFMSMLVGYIIGVT